MPCIHKTSGCEWDGELSELNVHLQTCIFSIVQCPRKCGHQCTPAELQVHLNSKCNKNSKCQHCGSSYEAQGHAKHNQTCPKFPTQCPNNCSVGFISREDMPKHLTEECEENFESCIFKELGCHYMGPHYLMERHVAENSGEHVMIVGSAVAKQSAAILTLTTKCKAQEDKSELLTSKCKTQDGKIETLTTKCKAQEDQIETLTSKCKAQEDKIETLTEEVKRLKTIAENPQTFLWTITNFYEKMNTAKENKDFPLYSSAFYSHPRGYKLRTVLYLNGCHDAMGTHCSIFIQIMKGEYDNELEWQYTRPVYFTVKDQKNEGKNHTMVLIPMTWIGGYEQPKTEMNIAQGIWKYMKHDKLYTNDYIMHDTIIIQVHTIAKKDFKN